ncbi:helix-turn-helix domain-containing protein [Pseudomaricurvus alkylphenolicus]|uniref:helix-turn-helix domain-containing protein n=1 Tax=Pseudomaricurvus alkylphenolicus TaxID=1306991 RepID=UPI001420F2CE|nr:helix-turn-helix domain-containing protein [Pseudomaricurvus alkylphenolicus]NIB41684.1 helix-turn-helix domain-containing protein [Pseudomaricurvus alkylphenolicus]
MINVAILTYDNLATFEFGCAVEIFAMERPEFKDWYRAEVVCFDSDRISARGNVEIQVKKIENLDDYDMLIIPGWCIADVAVDSDWDASPSNLTQQLQRFYTNGGRILSFCTGAFLLAEAGLLNGREVTTHWRYAERFTHLFPQVTFVNNVLYVYDGRIGCSAGSAAALDLGLEVVRQDFGHDKANKVARRLVIPPHRSGGQAQFVETPMIATQSHFSSTLDWAIQRLRNPIDVNILAEKANMSRRTFDRHFRASLGMSPKEWITRQRLNLAQNLLAAGDESMETIAQRAGFETAMNMRHHFRKVFGISPSQYQAQFAEQGRAVG